MTIAYDGSPEAFLTLVYEVYYKKLVPTTIIKTKKNSLIFDVDIEIYANKNQSQKVLEALKDKFTNDNLQTIYNCFLCDCYDYEMDLLEYIKIGFKNQKNLQNINIEAIRNIINMQNELLKVAHKMKGFLRFEELEDSTLYAKFDNKFGILIFLAKHFLARFNNQNFIIHDIGRNIAFVKNKTICDILKLESSDMPIYSENEEYFKKLWHTFFNNITIKSRTNEKLQRSQVSLIYRNYMSEFAKL